MAGTAAIPRGMRRSAAQFLSGVAFWTSTMQELVGSPANNKDNSSLPSLLSFFTDPLQRTGTSFTTLQTYLDESGISQELAHGFTKRFVWNFLVLWRIQREYRQKWDVRDLVKFQTRNPMIQIPTMEEASR